MKNKLSIILLLISAYTNAQNNTLTLEKCIEIALENNLKLKSSQLTISEKEAIIKQKKLLYSPSLNAAATHGYNWGQRIDPFTNQFASNRVRNNNLYVSSSWTIFSGFQNYYQVKKMETAYGSAKYNNQVQERNLKIDVTAFYLSILLQTKQVENAKEQLAFTKKQQKRIKKMIQTGHLGKLDGLEINSQLELDKLAIIKAENQLSLSKTKLRQLLNIPLDTDNPIVLEENLPTVENDFKIKAINTSSFPDVLALQKQTEASLLNQFISKSRLFPTLSINGSLGSGYSGNNVELINNEMIPKSFAAQLGENFYQSVSLSLSLPIHNQGITKSRIISAKIAVEKAKLSEQQIELDLQNKIEQLQVEVINATAQNKASKTALTTITEAFNNARVKYEKGAINYISYFEIKKKLFKAKSEFNQSAISLSFKKKLLGFYMGE